MLKSESSQFKSSLSSASQCQASRSKPSKAKLKFRAAQAAISVLWTMTAFLTLLSSALAQDFTLQAAPFSPDAVAPGGTSSSNITIGSNGSPDTVALTCQVSSTQATTSMPACAVSPTTVTSPAGATATVTTTGETTTVGYTITITGTGTSGTLTTTQSLTVLAVTPQFTITVLSPVVPNSVPAGSGAQGTIIINPINGYSSPKRLVGGETIKGITLSCGSITPLVTLPPICSFNPPSPEVNGTAVTSTVTVSTFGPIIGTGAVVRPRHFYYALWMPFPMLALLGLGAVAGGKRSRKTRAWSLLALFVMTGALFLMPACGNTTTTTTTPNGVTPNNTYTLTVVGVDADGVASSNITSTNSANPTISLTVTSPTN